MTRARAILLLALAAQVTACSSEHATPGTVGQPAPAYAAVTLDGDSVALADLRGEVVLLNMWATWCHPCREEIPALQRLHERHREAGLRVVGVSIDAAGEGARVRQFAREFGVTYAIWLDPEDRLAHEFYMLGPPTTVLIGRDGVVRWRHVGPVKDDDPRLQAALTEALTAPAPESSAAS